MSTSAKLVPIWVRILTGLEALLTLAFGLLGYFFPTSIFPGLSDNTTPVLNAAYEFSALNMAIAIALIIVGLVGVPESIAIVMIIRLLFHAQDIVISLLNGASVTALLVSLAFFVVELAIVVIMFRLVGRIHRTENA